MDLDVLHNIPTYVLHTCQLTHLHLHESNLLIWTCLATWQTRLESGSEESDNEEEEPTPTKTKAPSQRRARKNGGINSAKGTDNKQVPGLNF